MTRKICVVTGTRAEFGLLKWLMKAINNEEKLSLKVVATGMHLSPEFGLTYQEIEKEGFNIDEKVEMLLGSDTNVGITKSIGLAMIGFADAYERIKPDIVLVLGDRFEIFAATSAAMIAGIPIAHLHGGESTEGAFDEAMRHSITKMSQIHFVATDFYKKRVTQLGECPNRVFNVGGMGVDAIKRLKLLNKKELENSLGFNFKEKNLMITFHPITLEGENASFIYMEEILKALCQLKNTYLIFTMPNADTGGRRLSNMINVFVNKYKFSKAFKSLGQLKYLSILAQVDAVVGNSSSGLLEAPSFKVGAINIGSRQNGRVKAENVIDCEPKSKLILDSIKKIYSTEFKKNLKMVKNPYDNGLACEIIIEKLVYLPLDKINIKKFYDLN